MTVQGILGAWLALAVVLTGATQLRPPGLPVGPGEILLAGWIFLVGLLLLRGTVAFGPTFRALFVYWLLAFALLGLGALMGSTTGLQDRESAGHDALAFILAAIVTCFLALRWGDDYNGSFHLQLARQTFFICTAATTALLFVAQDLLTIGPVRFWYAGVRFAGWAKNPNQMALFAVAMPFLGWYLIQHADGNLRKLAYLAGIAGAIAVGFATLSDALRVAWVGGVCAVLGLFWVRSIVRGSGRFLYVSYLLVPLAVIGFGATLGPDIALKVSDSFERMQAEGDQGEERVAQWWKGIDVISKSPVVGIGPGRPGAGPMRGGEAHNTLVDWGMATGIFGILLHLGLLTWCGVRTLRAGLLPLFGIVVALTLFSLLHYTLRQPIYWLMLVLVLTLPEQRQARATQPSRRPEPLHPAPTGALRGET